MVTATKHMTADELLMMPDDGYRYELVRGELRKMSPAGHHHGDYALAVGSSLRVFTTQTGVGKSYAAETGFLLNWDHVRAPDASFVRQDRVEAARDTPGFFPGPPDLAVEVVSPNDRYSDVEEKVEDYLHAGTLAVIVVNPRNRTVRIHCPNMDVVTLYEDDILEVPEVIPGWRMPVRQIFE